MEVTENKFKQDNKGPERPSDEEVPAATYDPSKKYRWEPNSQFRLSGEDFGLVLNSLRQILSTPEAQRIMLLDKASQSIEKALARAVELGVVKEDK